MEKKTINSPKLEYYIDLVNSSDTPDIIAITLLAEEKAVVLKAEHCGTNSLPPIEFDIFFGVIEKLKNQIGKKPLGEANEYR